MLAEIDDLLPNSSPLREGLVKAGLALYIAFIDRRRGWIEEVYGKLEDPATELTGQQRAHLKRLGIDPDV